MNPAKKAKEDATNLFRLCSVNGVLDQQRAAQVVRQLGTAKPRGYLETLSQFRRLVKMDSDRRTALIETAMPLPVDLQASVQASLKRVYGAELNTSFSQNPDLIAGMRIRVGSDVYDGTVRARLTAVEQSF